MPLPRPETTPPVTKMYFVIKDFSPPAHGGLACRKCKFDFIHYNTPPAFRQIPATLKKFNREAFDNMIECIIVGDYNSEGNKLPRVARFVLKTGKEYKFEISKNSNKDNSNNDKNN